ncbi:MAG: tRNA isopentenyl-2-thiomethyl-A-37 hydroxylase MiaE [Bryobacteraceae bacterium]
MTKPLEAIAALPLENRTPLQWGRTALADPIALLIDHAFLEKKAAINAMELLTRWPGDWTPGWVETVTSVARDEASHLAQTVRILGRRGGRLERSHKSHYATALRALARRGGIQELHDRLLISALIELRSCERFAILAEVAGDDEHKEKVGDLAAFYKALFSSELGHYKVFLKLAAKCAPPNVAEARWQYMLNAEARIISQQAPGSGIHSGVK